MTEQEWLGGTNPMPLLEFLLGRISDRKLRLYACACCRRVWSTLEDDLPSRQAIEIAEQVADGLIPADHLQGVRDSLNIPSVCEALSRHRWFARNAAMYASKEAADAVWWGTDRKTLTAERLAQCQLLFCVAGNPFRSHMIEPAWLTPTVSKLARTAYEERCLPEGNLDSARLAILADALEDAGCDTFDILNHLRSPGPHALGCWPLDLILGKE